MPHPNARPCLAAVLLLLAACASAPVPAPGPAPRPFRVPPPLSPAPLPPKPLRLFCGETAKDLPFKSMGVPAEEDPVDVALTPRYVWVLFQPARLLRIDRT